ncbi:MAG: hypothetical protein O3B90_12080 [Actinomycetota bacterium]|nr:hypothetical protein [Actinomycetota bacterium]
MFAIFLNESQTLVKLLYFVHVLSIVAAFGPLFLYPRLQRAGETSAMAALHMKLVFPALILLWVVGMGMAGVNKFALAEMWWITITITLWVGTVAVSWFLIRPAISDTSDNAKKKMSMGIGITHLTLVASLVLMIFKPFVDRTYAFNS